MISGHLEINKIDSIQFGTNFNPKNTPLKVGDTRITFKTEDEARVTILLTAQEMEEFKKIIKNWETPNPYTETISIASVYGMQKKEFNHKVYMSKALKDASEMY